ncbi:glycosyltransferase [Lyngbya aestuarii]|uniref:glycosyltransferase n=1 Tax=Lyngbya aestuarii TaxID=118322 RepID=UPI00403DBB44
MLKIVVDATPISTKPSGIGFYVTSLIASLYNLQSQENFQLGIAYQPGFKNWLLGNLDFPHSINQYSDLHMLPIPVRLSNCLMENLPNLFNLYLEKYLEFPDVIHGTNYSVYPAQKSLRVMTIHDLTFIKYPQYTDSVVKAYSNRVKKCLQWANLVVTVSESSKKDIINYLHVEPEFVHVTPLASRYHHSELKLQLSKKEQKSINYDFSQPYILFVSTIEPRKNLNNLIITFNYLKEKYKIDHNLLLIGQKGWHHQPIFAAIEDSPWKHQIHHLGYLSDKLVRLFYSKADVFVYPSHYEGFGLPVLEAMTLGTPVVTSNTSSLPEVAGDAAIFVDPKEPIQIAEAILKVISDSQMRRQLIQKGKERAKLFSWQKTALETIKAYKSLL